MDIQKKLTTLAAVLRRDREKLLNEWLGTLRIGMEKPGAILSDDELRDHFGDLLEDLCDQLEVPLTENSEISALRHAESHGDTRWAQGYKLSELVREVSALRTVLIAAVVTHGHAAFSLHEQSLANIIVHRFFDALVAESVSFFAALSQDAVVLQERQHLAQELHDSACQTLQSAVFQLAVIIGKVDAETADNLRHVSTALKQGLDDVRAITHGLTSVIRKFEKGLPYALQEFANEISRVVPCSVHCDLGSEALPTKQAFQWFRIAQEAASNACKHARPKSIRITLRETDSTLELQVQDDGRGFDPADRKTSSGIGMRNMQQRARSIGAELSVESQQGVGTTVTCKLPKGAAVVGDASPVL